jgi:hypothetical protein
VNWGFAHFKTEEEREAATKGLQTMFLKGHVLEPILSYDRGPPPCCHFCGQVDSLAGEEGAGHRQKECPLRFKRPQVDSSKREFLQGRPSTYAEALSGSRRRQESKSINEIGPATHSDAEKKEKKHQGGQSESGIGPAAHTDTEEKEEKHQGGQSELGLAQKDGNIRHSPRQEGSVLPRHSPRAASSPRVSREAVPSPRLSGHSPRETMPSSVLNATVNPYAPLSLIGDDNSETAPDADVDMVPAISDEKGEKGERSSAPKNKFRSKKKNKNNTLKATPADTKAPVDNKTPTNKAPADHKADKAPADNKVTPATISRKQNAKKRHSKTYIKKQSQETGTQDLDLSRLPKSKPVRPVSLRRPPVQTQSMASENVQLGDPGPLTALQILQTPSLSSLYLNEGIEDNDSQLNDSSSKKRKTNTTDDA